MFYAHFILKKRGPLSRIWLAAHWDKKLTKAHIFETDIEGSVEAILSPQLKFELRTSSHLLLGVVRIYSRKAKYLLADCNEAFVKIKLAFRPGMVDLPAENREASLTTINLRQDFTSFDLDIVDFNNIDYHGRFAVNQSRPEDITMREEVACMPFVGDDGFGDFGFNVSAIPEVNLDDILFHQNADQVDFRPMQEDRYGEEGRYGEDEFDKVRVGNASERPGEEDDDECINDDCEDDDDSINDDFGGASDHKLFGEEQTENQMDERLYEAEPAAAASPLAKASTSANIMEVSDALFEEPRIEVVHPPEPQAVIQDLTTLIENDAEAFALGPIEVNTKERKTKRKRRLIIDEHKVISSETMKGQLSDSSDLVMSLDLAPPTKRLMLWKETGGVDKLFVLPAKPIVHKKLFKKFSRNLMTARVSDEDPEVTEMAADVDESRPGDESKIELIREETDTGAEHDMSQILDLCDAGDKNLSLDVPSSPPHLECSDLPLNDSTSNINVGPSTHHDDILGSELNFSPCIDRLPSLPVNDSALSTDNAPLAREEGSPLRKKRKQSHVSKAPSVEPGEPVPRQSTSSDFEDDLDNEDAIFDVEPAPSCSERANLRQELEEAELEEKLWNQRSTQMQHILRRKLETSSVTSFRQLTARNNRKQAASKFYTILVLTKARAIVVEQQEPFGDIEIRRGPAFTGIV